MIPIPNRLNYLSKDGFVQACSVAAEAIKALYDETSVEVKNPEWSVEGKRQGAVFHVALPVGEKRRPGVEGAILASLRNHLIERKRRELKRLARVEKDGFWIIWAETD